MSNIATFLRLDGNASSLLISNLNQQPVMAWLGDRLSDRVDASMLTHTDDNAHAFASLDTRAPLTLLPQLHSGYMGSASLCGRRQNTISINRFICIEATQQNQTIQLLMEDSQSKLSVTQTITLDAESDVLSFATELTNIGTDDYAVDWLASITLPLPGHFSQCISQHGRWGYENQTTHRHIGPGRIDISNQHGRTGHEHTPSLICADELLSEECGDALFLHLAWSGNYSLRVEQLNDGQAYIQAGMLLSPGERVLSAGESLQCPVAHVTRGQGLNTCTQRFHHFARNNILPGYTRSTRPVHANSWEALYFNLGDEQLCSLVDAAASIGAERFILDDGWFLNRRDDTAGLGDWTVDEAVFPNGLSALVKHVRSHGMQFGLWFEPEMINPDSNLYRQHPEWVLHFDNIDTPLARNQLVLDVARVDVSEYLFNSISALVQEYKIDYIKWDMNRDLVLPGNGQQNRASQQPIAVYALMQKLCAAHTNLEIESCSSGGARSDFGVLSQTGRVWASDNIDPISRARIQQGFLRFFPPEIMGAHVGHERAHLTDRSTSLHTRAIVALQGQFGFELDARKLDPDEITTLNHYTGLYKEHRDWLGEARYWQLPSSHEQLLASAMVSNTGDQAFFNIILLDSLTTTKPGCQRVLGLDPDTHYHVSLASSNAEQFAPFNKTLPDWIDAGFTCTGDLLMLKGIPLPVMPPQSALLIHCSTSLATKQK